MTLFTLGWHETIIIRCFSSQNKHLIIGFSLKYMYTRIFLICDRSALKWNDQKLRFPYIKINENIKVWKLWANWNFRKYSQKETLKESSLLNHLKSNAIVYWFNLSIKIMHCNTVETFKIVDNICSYCNKFDFRKGLYEWNVANFLYLLFSWS